MEHEPIRQGIGITSALGPSVAAHQIQEATAGSIADLLREVQRISRVWTPSVIDPKELWFRGAACRKHNLLPSLYRPDCLSLHYDEGTLFERFKVLAAPYVRRAPADDWDWYFLARHHRLPSRLLDWSESLLVALYFALEDHMPMTRLKLEEQLERLREPPVFDGDSPCVWVLDAGTLNRRTWGEDWVYVPGGPGTQAYLPESLAKSPGVENELPIAILPPRTNERIVAQQGNFTLHGHSRLSLEDIASSASGEPIRLARITLDRNGICHFWDQLQILGVGRLGLFPELDSVAAHVSWVCQSAK